MSSSGLLDSRFTVRNVFSSFMSGNVFDCVFLFSCSTVNLFNEVSKGRNLSAIVKRILKWCVVRFDRCLLIGQNHFSHFAKMIANETLNGEFGINFGLHMIVNKLVFWSVCNQQFPATFTGSEG